MFKVIYMENKYCRHCMHFQQHYALNGRKIFRIYCGHCTLHTARKRRPDTIACENFAPGCADEEAFATKEYLSKELLQYLLNLELLPPIENA